MLKTILWIFGICVVRSASIDDKTINYLKNYGYLSASPANLRFGDDLRHESEISNALKALQLLANINVTGKLDEMTLQLMKKPRCGNSDFAVTLFNDGNHIRRRRFALGPSKWNKLNLTWRYMNKNNPKTKSEAIKIRRIIAEAVDVWQQNSVLTITESPNGTADILIDFMKLDHGDNFSFEGRGGALAHAFYPGDSLGGDVHLDDDELWDIDTGNDIGEVDLFYTVLHELGHSLGLGHSSKKESIMFPWYVLGNFDRHSKELPEDDIIAIEQHYGSAEKKWGPIAGRTSKYPKKNRKTSKAPTTTTSTTNVQTSSTTLKPEIPDKCNMSYDAIAMIRNELMIFKGTLMWRLRDGKLLDGYPTQISRMWKALESYDHIDAVFERKDGKFAFFIGSEVVVIDNYRKAYTHNLQYLGIEKKVKKVDAIFRWGYNNKTFLFSDGWYWKLDDTLHTAKDEPKQYPRKISINWKKVGSINIDTAFQIGGITYFFDGNMYYEFDDKRMQLDSKPHLSAQKWMDCDLSESQVQDIEKSYFQRQMANGGGTADYSVIIFFTLAVYVVGLM